MPLVNNPYNPGFPFRNGHFSTIYSAKIRPTPKLEQKRHRLVLADKDFIDIDWSYSDKPSQKVTILLHGLEGNANRTYIKSQAKILNLNGWDTAAMNYRGCSGTPNLSYGSYNAGRTEDLHALLESILEQDKYQEIALLGFSLGGNMLIKYLGERNSIPKEIKKAVAISTPLNLEESLEALNQFENWVYPHSFLNNLRKKYKIKAAQFPEKKLVDFKEINSLLDFDNYYTAPAHGFKDAYEYYEKNSSLQFLPNIKIPIYLLNAKNDSFLSKNCYPYKLAEKIKSLYLEMPEYGGHVGFHKTNELYYSEERALTFLNEK